MAEVSKLNLENIPKNRYVVAKEEKVQEFYNEESHIHKQGFLSGAKAELHKLTNDVFTYFPKGFAGSKNSDFYEFLALGKIPNLIGSVMLIGLYSFANKNFNAKHGKFAQNAAKSFGAGVVLYALIKWLSKKIVHKSIKLSTGVDLDQRYIDRKIELTEPGQTAPFERIQYRQTLESMEFPRIDLWRKKGEIDSDDQEAEYKKIAEKNGWGKNLNATEQIVVPKLRQIKARTTALENITSYIAAATGVALGSREAFKNLQLPKFNLKNNISNLIHSFKPSVKNGFKAIKTYGHSLITTLKDAFIELVKGTKETPAPKMGKALVILTVASTFLTWLIPTIGFKKAPNTMKSKIDNKKEYEVG